MYGDKLDFHTDLCGLYGYNLVDAYILLKGRRGFMYF